jgi:hypothetical protein
MKLELPCKKNIKKPQKKFQTIKKLKFKITKIKTIRTKQCIKIIKRN